MTEYEIIGAVLQLIDNESLDIQTKCLFCLFRNFLDRS